MHLDRRPPPRTALHGLVCGALGLALPLLATATAAAPSPAAGTPAPDTARPAGEARPADETIRAIQERGRQIADYLEAVGAARARFARDSQGMADPDGVVALEDRDVWDVFFLKEGAKPAAPGLPQQGTVLLAQTEFSPAAGDVGQIRAMIPPHAAPSTPLSYARALQVGETAAAQKGVRGPHDAAVIREKDGTFSVYVQRRPEEAGKVRFGDDFVARVAASGRQLQSIEALHADATTVAVSGRAPGEPTLHTQASGDLPTPTDVAQVRRNPDLAPHLVLTPRAMFRIDAQGVLTYLGPNTAAPPPAATPAGGGGGRR